MMMYYYFVLCCFFVLICCYVFFLFFFSSRRRHTRWNCDWSSDVCSSDLETTTAEGISAQPLPEAAEIHASLAGVTRIYGNNVHALGPIDLELRRGEFFSVVGPSGCGKSTLLDVLAGLGQPSAGSITFEGKPVAGSVPEGIGVVFQEDSSFPWLTVRDNIGFGLRRAGIRGAELESRVRQAVEFMGLKDFATAYP